MKTKIFTLLLAVAASVGTMFAYDAKIGNLFYNLNTTNLTAEVTEPDVYWGDWYRNGTTTVSIPENITYNSKTYKVTSIGEKAFCGCKKLTSITIPSSITRIGKDAFWNCYVLTSVTIPSSVTRIQRGAFGYCKALTSVNIPNRVTSIEESVFYYCSSLTSITIPSSVTSIGGSAFSRCDGLTSVHISDIAAWCAISFGDNPLYYAHNLYLNGELVTNLVIPNSVTSIGNSVFSGCSGLTSVTIPNSVTSIGNSAFSGCSGLTSVTIPNSVTSIENSAFSGCSGLTSVTIPNSVTSIGDGAFSGCSNLTSVTIPNSVTSIGGNAFSSCSKLKTVTLGSNAIVSKTYSSNSNIKNIFGTQVTNYIIGSGVTSIGSYAFNGCSNLTSVTIPSSVTSIGGNAFSSCSTLKTVTLGSNAIVSKTYSSSSNIKNIFGTQVTNYIIGSGVTSIGSYAFSGCSNLPSVTIPSSVTSIGGNAFSACSKLQTITIPNSVTSIGGNAFVNCTSLTSINVNVENPNYSSVDGVLFDKNKTTLLQYPAGKSDAYIVPNSVTDIGNYAFYNCTGLTGVTISNTVTRIGQYAFNGCNSLTSAIVGNSVANIGSYAFNGCTSLKSIIIPNSVTGIGNYTFNGCTSLKSIIIPDNVTNVGSYAFSGCSGLTSATISNNITTIKSYTFNNCSKLASVIIGSNVSSIESNAFSGCSSLKTVTLNSNAITTKNYTASSNIAHLFGSQVEHYILGSNIARIGEYAFYSSSSWNTATFLRYRVPSIHTTAISNINGHVTAYVPCGRKEAYDYAFSLNPSYSKLWTAYAPLKYNIYAAAEDGTMGCVTVPQTECDNLIATPNYGYHFVQWSDGSTVNPRSLVLTKDTTFTAKFAKNPIVKYQCNAVMGQIVGDTITPTGMAASNITFEAQPNYGYHFIQWNDGVTENPRTIYLVQDTTFTAEFAINQYSINVSCDELCGHVEGENGQFDYQTNHTYEAIANYGYHFVQWSDGVKTNPRTITITKEETYTALFAKNTYSITKAVDSERGSISGVSQAEYLDNVTLTVNPNYGYHFTQWSDGITTNPRTFVLTQDTTFTAEFEKNSYTISTTSANQEWGTTAGDKSALYLENVVISATANYGYHFVKWNDNNTENPRTISVTKDATYTATFVKKSYSITKIANSTQGSISGVSNAKYLDNVTLTVNPNYGYHFTQWSDRNTNNPRTFILTQDTTFTAEFAKNTYTISTTSANPEWGTTAGDKSVLYLDTVVVSATANYGYHFVKWNDNNTSNPRIVSVTGDKTYTAIFAKDIFSITANAEHGSISGSSSAEYLDEVILSVSSDYGYHFTQWSDGVTDNPRTFVLTQDTTFTAEFAVDKSGTCGKDNLLQWTFADDGTLTISGNGELTENYTFGVEAPMQMQQLVIGNEVTSIGERAFYEKTTLQKLIIGSNVTSIGKYAFASINNRQLTSLVMPAELLTIGDYAFSGNTYLESIDFNAKLQSIGAYAFKDCYRVSEMTCLATVTPTVGTDALASINSYASLCVPAECLRKYQVDPNWGRFDLCELGASSTTTDGKTVIVEPSDNTALFTWPTENNAGSYTLQISKDGEIFCTLVFNSNGQLTGIAFAPGRNGAAHAPAATMSVAGMSFTVTGLNVASKYAYRLAVADDASEELVAYSGEFATTGYNGEVNPGGNPEGVEDVFTDEHKASKILRNGQIFILRGEKEYTLTGQEVK